MDKRRTTMPGPRRASGVYSQLCGTALCPKYGFCVLWAGDRVLETVQVTCQAKAGKERLRGKKTSSGPKREGNKTFF